MTFKKTLYVFKNTFDMTFHKICNLFLLKTNALLLSLSYLNIIVVDECDRMFEEQFFDQIEHIFKFAARGRLRQVSWK